MTKQILNLIADQLNVLIMINKSENHAVTFLSRSAEWLFGIKREVISCAEDLLNNWICMKNIRKCKNSAENQ